MMAPKPITLTDVSLAYGRDRAVRNLSGEFLPGSLTAIVGPNGAGKTTLLKALAGLIAPVEGRIQRDGLTPRDIGYLPQDSGIDRSFPIRVFDLAAMGLVARRGLFRFFSAADRATVRDALAQVGLADHANRPIGALSAGQFQRLLFARLIVQDAAVLLLDEPFNAVDEQTTEDLVALIGTWHDQGRTIAIVLHDLALARRLCPQSLAIERRAA